MRILSRGERVPLATLAASDDVEIGVAIDSPFTIDVSCFALDETGTLAAPPDDHIVFFNQPKLGEAVALVDGTDVELYAFRVDLARVAEHISRLVVVASIDGEGSMSEITNGDVTIRAGGDPIARFPLDPELFTTERAIMLAELYRRDGWRVATIGQGFAGGLDALVVHFGGSVETATEADEAVFDDVDHTETTPLAGAIVVRDEVTVVGDGQIIESVSVDAVTISMAKVDANPPVEATSTTTPRTPRREKAAHAVRTAKSASSTMPTWERTVRERLARTVKSQQGPLTELVARNANESDTRIPVTELLVEGLGYDRYADITTEMRVKADLADYGLRIDEDLVASRSSGSGWRSQIAT